MKNLPNFLIVGVPKAGTTSLYYFLKQHPEVFMSPIKEPHYFSQIFNDNYINKWEDYIELFKDVKHEKVIGEASTSYFHFYKKSIPLIKEKLGDPKIIVILRNPIERFWSHFLYYKKLGRETGKPEDVIKADYIVKREPWKVKHPYYEFGFYAQPLKEFISNFSKVKVMLYDDLENNPEYFVKEICNFLDIDSQIFPKLEKRNVSGIPRNQFISFLLSLEISNKIIPYIPYFIKKPLRKILIRKENIPSHIKEHLLKIYKEDIIEVSKILKKDLSRWMI